MATILKFRFLPVNLFVKLYGPKRIHSSQLKHMSKLQVAQR